MVRIAEHPLEQQLCLIQLSAIRSPGPREGLHQPKTAHVERAFRPRESIHTRRRVVAMDEAVGDKSPIERRTIDRLQCAEHPRVSRRNKAYQRHDQVGRIKRIAAVRLHEGAA